MRQCPSLRCLASTRRINLSIIKRITFDKLAASMFIYGLVALAGVVRLPITFSIPIPAGVIQAVRWGDKLYIETWFLSASQLMVAVPLWTLYVGVLVQIVVLYVGALWLRWRR